MMDSIWDGEPSTPDAEQIVGLLRQAAAAADEGEFRLMAFHESVATIPGPVGVLLRQIAHVHDEYETARKLYGTTEGEAVRLGWVLDDAMSLVESMRGDLS